MKTELSQLSLKNHGTYIVAFVLGVGISVYLLFPTDNIEAPVVTEATTTETHVLEPAQPMVLSIPAISLETTFEEPLGLNSDNTIEVPEGFEQVGWYKYGPTPGELGPAVVLGHVDSYLGPAIFFSLGQLEPGDDIYIDREDGSKAHFKVTELTRNKQAEFPTRLVYGDIDHAGLRLVTCSGAYQQNTQRYTHNLIVFAELVE